MIRIKAVAGFHSSGGLVVREWSSHHQASGSKWSAGVCVLVGTILPLIVDFSHLDGILVPAKQL